MCPTHRSLAVRTALLLCLTPFAAAATSAADSVPHADIVREDEPTLWIRFDGNEARLKDVGGAGLAVKKVGPAAFGKPGPRPETYPTFATENDALVLDGRSRLAITDPGENSPLDFGLGDAITIEAWVQPTSLGNGNTRYVIGKGRTGRKGVAADNQNYALRLVGKNGRAGLSFLFRGEANRPGNKADWHRWDTASGFPVDGYWHHVAVAYEFGKPDSIRTYIDGKPAKGTWDTGYGGTSKAGPVVDDDEVWIGSSMNGSPNSSLVGGIDEIALYRRLVPAERIALRYVAKAPEPYVRKQPLPDSGVLVEVFEQSSTSSAFVPVKPPTTEFVAEAFGFTGYPNKYDDRGLRTDYKAPLLLRATAEVQLPPGEYDVLLRSRGDARLLVDEHEVAAAKRLNLSGSAHGHIIRASKVEDDRLHPLWAGDNETVATFASDGEPHQWTLKMVLGEKSRRPDTGESLVAVRRTGENEMFVLLGNGGSSAQLDHDGWYEYERRSEERLDTAEREVRLAKGAAERAYWKQRHDRARDVVAGMTPIELPPVFDADATRNEIDRFVNAKLAEQGLRPHELVDDWAFLRRVTVDLIGTVPTEEQIETFFSDESPNRREKYVDRLLQHPGWADNWVGYWQDVLAENPNLLKPTLNNTGPFRWWIHEAFVDNRPIDRFVTELVTMKGSRYYGGPNGFEMATENDVPMAAKAHVVAQAFLGHQMKCARCHDAPFRDFAQRDLFELAAMLKRGSQAVPKSSSVPVSKEELEDLIVTVSLEPGSNVAPRWPFGDLVDARTATDFVRNPNDSREQLAGLITSPHNDRFAQVVVNRLWRRYTGHGIVDPVDDWSGHAPSHPELLEWLGREFVTSGYDLKHVARLIVNSHTYQRQTVDSKLVKEGESFHFAGPLRRRMSAEQILDSMFVAAGKDLKAGELNFDVDGANNYAKFLNLGRPDRAWHFTSLSNERDRPSLALPFAQDFVSHLETFGWRSSRQDPLTVRDTDPTAAQPAMMANGIVTGRVTRLSDDAEITELALESQPLDEFVNRLVARFLTREPTSEQRELFASLLDPGYASRREKVDPEDVVRHPAVPQLVSWSNHLSEEANSVKVELEQRVRAGDPPSIRLDDDWRQRAEDAVWALVNSPEFVFLP